VTLFRVVPGDFCFKDVPSVSLALFISRQSSEILREKLKAHFELESNCEERRTFRGPVFFRKKYSLDHSTFSVLYFKSVLMLVSLV